MFEGFGLFKKTSDSRRWLLAFYHSPHSLTWRWTFSFGFYPARRVWPIFQSYRTNDGLQWWLRIPFVGMLDFHQQRPMWYRNLFQRLRDERDMERGHLQRRDIPPMLPEPTHEGSHFVQ